MQEWALEFVPREQRGVWNIKTVSIQEAFRDDGVTPVTRLWLAAPDNIPPSLQMLVHKNRDKVN